MRRDVTRRAVVDDDPVTSTDELDRRTRIAALDDHLTGTGRAHGPVPQEELDVAERRVDDVEAAMETSARTVATAGEPARSA